MFIAPGRERLSQSVAQFLKIRQRARTLVVFATYCRLCHVAMAVLVDADGKIASELAAGAPAVLQLAGQEQAQVRSA